MNDRAGRTVTAVAVFASAAGAALVAAIHEDTRRWGVLPLALGWWVWLLGAGAVSAGVLQTLLLARAGAGWRLGRRSVAIAVGAVLPSALPWAVLTAWMVVTRNPPTCCASDIRADVEAYVAHMVAPLLASAWFLVAPVPLLLPARRSWWLPVACAAVFGGTLLWGGLLYAAIAPWIDRGARHGDLADVLVPTRDLPSGTRLERRDLDYLRIPVDYLPDEVTLRLGAPVLGRVTSSRLLRGELLRSERLAPGPDGPPMWTWHWWDAEGTPTADGRPPDTELVQVWARDLSPGHVAGEDDLYAVQIVPVFVHGPVVQAPEQVVGLEVCEPVLNGEFVRAERLAPPGHCPWSD